MSQLVSGNSRRNFLSSTAKLVVGGTAAMSLKAQTPPGFGSDVDSLNYALTLEYLESPFYTQFLGSPTSGSSGSEGGGSGDSGDQNSGGMQNGQNPVLTGPVVGNPPAFTSGDFAGSKLLTGVNCGMTSDVMSSLGMIRDHEQAHVAALITAIQALGGVPVQPCTYTFPVKTVDEFLAMAQTLENAGVSAYDGAITNIQGPDLRTTAATIATVEARHAAYLNLLNGASPYPSATDQTHTVEEVVRMVAPFMAGCTTPVAQTVAIVTPNMITTSQPSLTLDASASTSARGPLSYYYQILPGSMIPSLNSDANSPKAYISFVNGAGVYKVRLTVRDIYGHVSSQDITLTYQP